MESHQDADDDFILNLANKQQRILLTQDKDFGELVFRVKSAHFGVVLIRLTDITLLIKPKLFRMAHKDGKTKPASYLHRTAQPHTLAIFRSWGSSVGAGRIRLAGCKYKDRIIK